MKSNLVILPDKNTFIERAQRGELYPVYAELPFIPPQQAFESLRGPYSFLFESIKGPEKIARYSFAGNRPFLMFTAKNGTVELISTERNIQTSKSPLKILKNLLSSYKIKSPPGFPPFLGGAVGIISYDFVHYFEQLPKTAHDDLHIPDAHFLLINTCISFDHKDKKTVIISCPGISDRGFNVRSSKEEYGIMYEEASEQINALYRKINLKKNINKKLQNTYKKPIKIHYEMHKSDYERIVRKAKEYIKDGDIFQANISQRVSAHIGNTEPWELYKILSRINPSPFAAYLDMQDYQIVSSSPERLLFFNGTTVETRPIAGTRPRGLNAQDDVNMREDLLLNEKERAEHLMLIDLERNDLGKISYYGSVYVDEFMITEDYSHVIHIVSNIKGTPVENKNCFDAIRAAFPGGTITGVPKVRCMEIIDELEPITRGPYTGSLGYISFTGTMDLNIIIRTFVIKEGKAYVQAGAGIVADSDPAKEYFETLKKAEALIKTLEIL
jgi:anthranilate/para-aminobenzoate synthase component I